MTQIEVTVRNFGGFRLPLIYGRCARMLTLKENLPEKVNIRTGQDLTKLFGSTMADKLIRSQILSGNEINIPKLDEFLKSVNLDELKKSGLSLRSDEKYEITNLKRAIIGRLADPRHFESIYGNLHDTAIENIIAFVKLDIKKWTKSFHLLEKKGIRVSFGGFDFLQSYAYIEFYDEILKIDSRNVYVWFCKGRAFHYQKEYNAAVQAYEEVLKLDPIHHNAYYYKGLALTAQSRYAEAIGAFDEVIKIEPCIARAWRYKGLALESQGKYSEAVEAYDEALKIHPGHIDTLCFKGIALLMQEKYSDAVKTYDEVLQLGREKVDDWRNDNYESIYPTNFGHILERDGILMSKQNYASVSYWKGRALYCQGKYSEAVDAFNAIKITPRYIDARYYKGRALHRQGKYVEAVEAYEEVLKIKSGHMGALGYKADALIAVGKYMAAIETLEDALKINPDDTCVIETLGNAYTDFARSKRNIKTNSNVIPIRIVTLNNKGVTLIAEGKYTAAIETFKEVLEIDPENAFAMENLGKAYTGFAKLKKAMEKAKKS